jgi:hypothetical protein
MKKKESLLKNQFQIERKNENTRSPKKEKPPGFFSGAILFRGKIFILGVPVLCFEN